MYLLTWVGQVHGRIITYFICKNGTYLLSFPLRKYYNIYLLFGGGGCVNLTPSFCFLISKFSGDLQIQGMNLQLFTMDLQLFTIGPESIGQSGGAT